MDWWVRQTEEVKVELSGTCTRGTEEEGKTTRSGACGKGGFRQEFGNSAFREESKNSLSGAARAGNARLSTTAQPRGAARSECAGQ